MSETRLAQPHPRSVLHTKLMPPRLAPAAIQREDRLARLDDVLTRKVGVVAAPTGFGKTTMVRTWCETRAVPCAWLTLDDYDNDPVRFWTYVCLALRTLDPGLGKAALSMLAGPQPPSFVSVLTPLINDLARLEAHVILILEDYHAIKSAEIASGMSFLIQHLPARLHLVFLTRTDPDLPLSILRARDELVEITAAELRFNPKEAEDFLHAVTDTDLSAALVTRLLEKTEGWPAGLRLAALALQHRGSTADLETWMESFSGSDRYVAEYLTEEVFESQRPEIQSFLLRTSFLRRLTGPLCDAVLETDQSAATLKHLERDNLFLVQLERGGERLWYRYHALFGEALQYLARQHLAEEETRSLYEKACHWYEEHGLFDEAIETALTARLFDDAIRLVEIFIERHDLSELHTILRWLETIPQQQILRHPRICFSYAQVLLYSGDRFAPATAVRIEPFLQAAETAWRTEADLWRLGQLHSFRGNVLWWQGDLQKAFAYVRLSLEELPEQDVYWRGNSLLGLTYEALSGGRILEAQDAALEARALLGAAQNLFGVLAATQFLAEIFYWQGELEQAEQLNRQIQAQAVGDESMLDDQGIASLNLAHIAYERNELDQAGELAVQALHLAEQRGNEMLQVQAAIRLAHIHAARGDVPRGRELLKPLEAQIRNAGLLREIHDAQGLLAIRAADTSSLEWWIKVVSAKDGNALPLQQEREAFTLARLQIAEGKISEALAVLKLWREDAARHGRARSRAEALCLEALAHQAASRTVEAERSLVEALTLGQAKGFRRLFLDEGSRMASLLQEILPASPDRSPSSALRASLRLSAAALLQSFPSELLPAFAQGRPAVQVEPLSQQELRVLRLLAAGLSNPDIAQELVVSANTVKTHVKSIYRKLNVRSRGEARQVARELKLV